MKIRRRREKDRAASWSYLSIHKAEDEQAEL
jgi:hypothetical protein